jgi:hypothetical protein
MPQQTPSAEPRISLEAIKRMDDLARGFRRKLRDRAVQLSQADASGALISPEIIGEAMPFVCRELLSAADSKPKDQRDSDDRRPEAA